MNSQMSAIPASHIAVAVIMRLKSSRLPLKMLQHVGGRPLAQIAFETARAAARAGGTAAFAMLYEPTTARRQRRCIGATANCSRTSNACFS